MKPREELERSSPDRLYPADRHSTEFRPEIEPQIQEQEREVERAREFAGPADVAASSRDTALLAPDVVEDFRTRWDETQAGFVDEPRRAVEQANGLVSDAIQRLAQSFDNERGRLEAQWDRDGDVSTEGSSLGASAVSLVLLTADVCLKCRWTHSAPTESRLRR